MFDATATAAARTPKTLPDGTLAWGKITVKELRTSAAGNKYFSIEVACEAPHAGHRILSMIMLTENGVPSERGMSAVRSILEANGLSVEDNPEAFRFATEQDVGRAINGKRAAFKTRVKDTGYDDIRFFLSPGTKDWKALNGAAASVPAEAADDGIAF